MRRDLEWLLNSRRIADPPDEGLKDINESLYVYGLPDLSTLTWRRRRPEQAGAIFWHIKLFEPRLANVRLVIVETPDSAKKDVRLRIEAMLRLDPAPEPVILRHGDRVEERELPHLGE